MKLRDLRKMRGPNDGSRTLFESAMVPEVAACLKDWILETNGTPGVLIGGMAMSFYGTPRYTQDCGFLYLTSNDVPTNVNGFKRHRSHAFEHRVTGVEVEIITPETINMSASVAHQIVATSTMIDGCKVASPSGIVAAKLGRLKLYDKGDIEMLINNYTIDLSPFDIPSDQLKKYEQLKHEIGK